MGKYLKAAFLYKWNLLAFLGGLGFSILSGDPGVGLALLAAGELTFLTLLGTNSKFQKYVDAREASKERLKQAASANQALKKVLRSLPRESIERFEELRTRCEELRQIALDRGRPGRSTGVDSLAQVQLQGLDRLLWIYLKLLFSQYSLRRFFQKTQRPHIQEDIKRIEERIRTVESESTSSQRDRILETLRDNLETSRQRITNYDRARENYELVEFELERFENKISSISEMAVNRQDPNFISGQVDQVANSMFQTEETINELRFVTGFSAEDDEVPELVSPTSVHVKH